MLRCSGPIDVCLNASDCKRKLASLDGGVPRYLALEGVAGGCPVRPELAIEDDDVAGDDGGAPPDLPALPAPSIASDRDVGSPEEDLESRAAESSDCVSVAGAASDDIAGAQLSNKVPRPIIYPHY